MNNANEEKKNTKNFREKKKFVPLLFRQRRRRSSGRRLGLAENCRCQGDRRLDGKCGRGVRGGSEPERAPFLPYPQMGDTCAFSGGQTILLPTPLIGIPSEEHTLNKTWTWSGRCADGEWALWWQKIIKAAVSEGALWIPIPHSWSRSICLVVHHCES